MSRGRFAMLLCAALSLAGAAPLFPQDAGARAIAIFPYGDAEGSLKREDAFARYAIPDILRMDISGQGRFSLVEKAAVEEAWAGTGLADGEDRASPETMSAMAKALGADHYIWGYIGSLNEGLCVFHNLVDAESGKTVHSSFGRLPAGEGVFDAAERSAHEFSAWINADLPARAPDVVYVEKEVIVEKPAPGKPAGRGIAIGADFSCRLFAFRFAQWLRPALRAGFHLDLPEDARGFRLGFVASESPLFQQDGPLMVLNGIAILQTSLYARGSYAFRIAPRLGARLGAMAGASFFAGYVSPQTVAYFRPGAAFSAAVEYYPSPRLCLGLAASAELTLYAWGSDHMLEAAPSLYVRYFP